MKLNLGCGANKIEGYVNLDKYTTFDPDIVHDLESFPWPFADGSVEDILAIHVLEHLGERTETFLRIIQELYRVMAPEAELLIAVPHHRSDNYSDDPTHVRRITYGGLTLFSKQNCKMWRENGASNSPLADYLDVDFEIVSTELKLSATWYDKITTESMTPDAIKFAYATYNNVAEEVRFILRKIT